MRFPMILARAACALGIAALTATVNAQPVTCSQDSDCDLLDNACADFVCQASTSEQTLLPNDLLGNSNYVTTVALFPLFNDDPDSNTDWGPWDGSGNTTVRLGFPTPSSSPSVGAGLQTFRVAIRKTAAGGNDTYWQILICEYNRSVGPPTSCVPVGFGLTSATGTGEIISATWNADFLQDSSGANVVVRIDQATGGTGAPDDIRGLEVGGAEWVVKSGAGATCVLGTAAPSTTPCGDSGSECVNQDYCDGLGSCTDNGFKSAGTACGDPTSGECDAADTCDGAGTCSSNYAASGTACGDTGVECLVDDTCNGLGSCTDNGFEVAGTACGDPSDTECTNPDACDGGGACLDNHEPATTACGDNGAECIAQDYCGDYTGVCEDSGLLPCGLVNAGGCPIDEVPAKDGSDFKLLFTPDLDNWVAYKLNASNPGQMFYTLVSDPDIVTPVDVAVLIPFPFVTQGAMSLHVFDAADVATDPEQPGCLFTDEMLAQTSLPVEITMEDYWAATDCTVPEDLPENPGIFCFDESFEPTDLCPGDYADPAQALGHCVYFLPFPVETPGQFVAELHLDYGLKGKWADVYCPDDGTEDTAAFDRYLPVNPGAFGDFDAVGLNVTDDLDSGCDIPSCTDYLFAHEVLGSSGDFDTVASVNYFRNPAGVFGEVSCDGEGQEGLTVKLLDGDEEILSVLTDEDGMYTMNFGHKGKAAWYTVALYDGGTMLATTAPDQDIPLQSKGFAEQNFYGEDGDDADETCGDGEWIAEPYVITKGRFKTAP